MVVARVQPSDAAPMLFDPRPLVAELRLVPALGSLLALHPRDMQHPLALRCSCSTL